MIDASTLKVGDKIRDHWNANNGGKGDLWHVRGFVDHLVILRTWRSARWRYTMERRESIPTVYRENE